MSRQFSVGNRQKERSVGANSCVCPSFGRKSGKQAASFFRKILEKKSESLIITIRQAGIAQLVEHNLAKVGVASSSLVSRSTKSLWLSQRLFSFHHLKKLCPPSFTSTAALFSSQMFRAFTQQKRVVTLILLEHIFDAPYRTKQ